MSDRNDSLDAARLAVAAEDEGHVDRIDACDLVAHDGAWRYAETHAREIEANWQAARALNPGYFNGRIFVLERGGLTGPRFSGTVLGIDFASFLYWRDRGFPPAGVRDVFGSALIRSSEGHVLLGRQRAGHVNGGRIYPPGGFIDTRDVRADGTIDIPASTARELAEETGLDPADFAVRPGLWLTQRGHQVSLAVEFRSRLTSAALHAEAVSRMGTVEDELTEFVVIRSPADLTSDVLPVARALLRAVFAANAG